MTCLFARATAALLVILLLASVFSSRAADAAGSFDSGNKLFAQGKYTEAVAAYESILASGSANATVWFNLGNAYFKAGQTGKAIAAYRQAGRLAPRDPDVRANLQFARNRVSGNDSVNANLWQRTLGRLTLGEWALMAAAAFWLWFALLALREWKPSMRRSLGGVTLLAGVLTVFLGGCAASDWAVNHGKTAVVITHDAAVKTGPLDDSQAAFTAKDGTELSVLDERDDWLQVGDGHNRIGWVKRDVVQVL